jgi:anti-sigma regulatory factor (Ser/Thr protein kinase)
VLALGIPLDAAALEPAQERIETFLEGQGVSPRARYKVRLVLDELLANLIMHGRFADSPPPVQVEVAAAGDGVALALVDAAEPFDPRVAPGPQGPPSLDDDKVGGLGLALVRKMAEITAYLRLPDGRNRTELAISAA